MDTAILTISEMLGQIRTRGLQMEAAGRKLRCGPSGTLTQPLRTALRTHKRKLLPVLRTWGPLTGLNVLYLLYEVVPAQPFRLDQARFASNPGLLLLRLYQDVQAGPRGPRARTGALQEDLQLLFDTRPCRNRRAISEIEQGVSPSPPTTT